MEVVLLKDIGGIGKKGERASVPDGYARNYLIPRQMAVSAASNQGKQVASTQESKQAARDASDAKLKEQLAHIDGVRVAINANANEKGHLFQGVHTSDVAAAIEREHQVSVPSDAIAPDEAIKELGEHTRQVQYGGASATITVHVQST
jgi:large subunit ribosomal protein L9